MSSTVTTEREAPGPPRPRRLWVFGLLALVVFLLGGAGGSYQGKLADVQKNDNSSFLPSSAESTRVDTLSGAFTPTSTIPGFLVYQRSGGLTAADRTKIAADVASLRSIEGVEGDQVGPAQISEDGTTASVSAPLVAKRGDVSATGPELADAEKRVEDLLKTGNPDGLVVHTAGPGGILSALIEAFDGIDGKLLLGRGRRRHRPAADRLPQPGAVVLPAVQRGPVARAGLHRHLLPRQERRLTLNGQSQGILSVLVIGAGTDYALLLISRYREELHVYASRRDAMVRAWRGAAPAIAASAATVIIGLLCLLVSELNSNSGLGPVAAIGIACTFVVMLTFLPVVLVLCGRWVFWPRIPRVDQQTDLAAHGGWARVAGTVGRRARPAWVLAAVVLLALVAFVPTLKADGLSTVDGFTNNPDAVRARRSSTRSSTRAPARPRSSSPAPTGPTR